MRIQEQLARVDWSAVKVASLSPEQWSALARRVANGLATVEDAERVLELGLMPQALRIRQGLATALDAQLINLQAQIRLLDEGKQQVARKGAKGRAAA